MNLRDMLIRDERLVLSAYEDSLGYLTIGVGRLIDKRKGGGISHDEAMFLLDNDISNVKAQLEDALPWIKGLNEARQAVLYSMCFQMGLKGLLGFRSTLASVRDEHFANAAEGMRQSLWAKQTPERAKRLAYQMDSGEWQ